MRSSIYIFFQVLMVCSFVQLAQAAEPETSTVSTPIQDSKVHIQALQEALIAAKNRVSELETELGNAQNTIAQLENHRAHQAADSALVKESTQAGQA